ncbi:MAG: TonB-dependent receptor [Ignavibacteriaceae bacterium]|nr:TonB-dependent receptor [Ignavibacteriaceae bacterium]
MIKRITMLLLFLSLPSLLLAQGRINGKVTDLETGEPLIGANVLVVGTSYGAATDVNGEYLIINLSAGTVEVKCSYIGYQSITQSDVRVTTGLTNELNFQLPAEGVSVADVVVIAERPLIQKDNTNKIRTTTSEDIDNLPVRGVDNIISLTAGVVQQSSQIFIRGGRQDEVGFYLEGANIKNPELGGRSVTIPQDALEEIQVQAGGYTAEFGGANAGIIRQQLKSGANLFNASFEFITDNITFKSKDDILDGEQRLGTTWWGYNEMSGVISGPILDPRYRFFINANYIYNKDLNPQPYPGINLGNVVDPVSKDSVTLNYAAGPVKNNSQDVTSFAGTLTFDFSPVSLRLSGTFSNLRQDLVNNAESRNFTPILSILNPRVGERDISNGSFSAKVTHVISPQVFYEVIGGYYLQDQEDFDQYLKDDYWSYGDSLANANAGWVWERSVKDISGNKIGRYQTPTIRNVLGFGFNGYGEVPVNYQKRDRKGFNASAAMTYFAGKHHTLKLGGEYQQYTLRRWSVAAQDDFASLLDSRLQADPNADVDVIKREILITQGINNYGYDVYGNEVDDSYDDPLTTFNDGEYFGPHQPTFIGAYVQDRIDFNDIIINAGLRFDYFDVDNYELIDPALPDAGMDAQSGEFIPEGWQKSETSQFVSPRLGISFPVTDNTVFHAQYGQFVQQSRLLDIYQGYYRTTFEIKGGFFQPAPVGRGIRPSRTTQYEIGFTQLLAEFLSFDITMYYKDVKDQVVYIQQDVDANSSFQSYNTLANGDFATTKGIEITLNMRRFERIAANASISFQDAKGTGSFPNSNRGIVGAPLENRAFIPAYVSPLTFNNALRGNINLDYRFGPNDGPGALHDFGISLLAVFTSGHPYTQGTGAADLEGDARNRQPVEPLNASTTPSTFQVDLGIDKTFTIYDRLAASIYIRVTNLFDAKNVENVFLRTGSATDDGYISDPELTQQLLSTYGPQYEDVYRAINIDYAEQWRNAFNGGVIATINPYFYGPPRSIVLGVKLSY